MYPNDAGRGDTVVEMGDGSRHPVYTTGAVPEDWRAIETATLDPPSTHETCLRLCRGLRSAPDTFDGLRQGPVRLRLKCVDLPVLQRGSA